MTIMLGNLSLQQALDRLGVDLPDETKNKLNDMRQMSANDINNGEWHCFDIPFMFVCGDEDTKGIFIDALSPLAHEMKVSVSVAVSNSGGNS